MMIQNNTIFYFTGTGNSLQVAEDLNLDLRNPMKLQPISQLTNEDPIHIHTQCIGFVFPVYMLGIPIILGDFLKKLTFKGNTYLFAIATCGGNSGRSFVQINEFLNKKNQNLSAQFTIKMPGNNLLRYGAKPIKEQLSIFEQEKTAIKNIAGIISSHQTTELTKLKPIVNILGFMAYKKLENQYGQTPAYKVTDKCVNCELCKKVCCVNNVQIVDHQPVWGKNCQLCMACIQFCPKEAIEYGNKTTTRARYINPNIKLERLLSNNS